MKFLKILLLISIIFSFKLAAISEADKMFYIESLSDPTSDIREIQIAIQELLNPEAYDERAVMAVSNYLEIMEVSSKEELALFKESVRRLCILGDETFLDHALENIASTENQKKIDHALDIINKHNRLPVFVKLMTLFILTDPAYKKSKLLQIVNEFCAKTGINFEKLSQAQRNGVLQLARQTYTVSELLAIARLSNPAYFDSRVEAYLIEVLVDAEKLPQARLSAAHALIRNASSLSNIGVRAVILSITSEDLGKFTFQNSLTADALGEKLTTALINEILTSRSKQIRIRALIALTIGNIEVNKRTINKSIEALCTMANFDHSIFHLFAEHVATRIISNSPELANTIIDEVLATKRPEIRDRIERQLNAYESKEQRFSLQQENIGLNIPLAEVLRFEAGASNNDAMMQLLNFVKDLNDDIDLIITKVKDGENPKTMDFLFFKEIRMALLDVSGRTHNLHILLDLSSRLIVEMLENNWEDMCSRQSSLLELTEILMALSSDAPPNIKTIIFLSHYKTVAKLTSFPPVSASSGFRLAYMVWLNSFTRHPEPEIAKAAREMSARVLNWQHPISQSQAPRYFESLSLETLTAQEASDVDLSPALKAARRIDVTQENETSGRVIRIDPAREKAEARTRETIIKGEKK
ncbi:MAG: hypothetical protein ABIA04_04905 [Pseudomonadota bacterium]